MYLINRFFYTAFLISLCCVSQSRALVVGSNDEFAAQMETDQLAEKIVLINQTGEPFSCFLPDTDARENVLFGSFAAFVSTESSVFYINTIIPSRTNSRSNNNGEPIMDRASFGLNVSEFRAAVYNVTLISEFNGYPIYDAGHHALWQLIFTEAFPENPGHPHVVIKSRLK